MAKNKATNKTKVAKEFSKPPIKRPTSASAPKGKFNPSILVLQWLTYAFWGWTALTYSALLVSVLWYFMVGPSEGSISFAPYGAAAVIVLTPVSLLCSSLYAKHDRNHKTGISSVIMSAHAVIFALLAIGSLIIAVLASVLLITSNQDRSDTSVYIISGVVISLIYFLIFLRVLKPKQFKIRLKIHSLIIVMFSIALLALAVSGPLKYSVQSKTDRLIEDNLSNVEQDITNYVRQNNKLPKDLSTVASKGSDNSSAKLIDKGVLVYKPNTKDPLMKSENNNSEDSGDGTKSTTFFYQLCVNFRFEGISTYYVGYEPELKDDYISGINTYQHPKGETCYNIKTNGYNDYDTSKGL